MIQSSTNGIEPPRSLISAKRSKAGIVPVVVPHVDKWADSYTLAFDMENNEGYLRVAATIQKFFDMSMSTNVYYNVSRYPDKAIPQDELIRDTLIAYKYGIKSLYYSNTYDGDTQSAIKNEASLHLQEVTAVKEEEMAGCESGACTL